MATLGSVATKARALTHSDTTSYPAANLLIDINLEYEKIVTMILESQDDTDWEDPRQVNYPIATRVLVAGQRDYSFATASWSLQGREGAAGTASQTLLPLKIKRVDVTYNGTDYYRATPFDDGVPEWGFGTVSKEDANFTSQAPFYDVKYNAISIYPAATAAQVTAGAKVRIEFSRDVVVFTTADYTTDPTDSTVIPGIDSPFHMMIAYGAAYEYANANMLPQLQNIKDDLAIWEQRLRAAYGRKDQDTVMYLAPGNQSYGDFGAYGGYPYSS